ncbi:MAG: cytochrome c biogenesis protein CcsA [Deltaproteobacteria bacterium]|nr:cytochrome c biogenesis protein CcsA [Deltaproteobacteria bacterium]
MMSFLASYFPWHLTAGLYAGSLLFRVFRKDRTAGVFLCMGFIANTLFLISRSHSYGIFVPVNLVTETYFLPWCLALLTGITGYFEKDKPSAVYGMYLIFFFSLMALLIPVNAHPPAPQHDTVFAPLFFVAEVMAHACFFLGGWLAFFCLIKRTEMPVFNNMAIWGFVLYSLAQIFGAVWAFEGWGAPFHWSERHLQSASLWCFYAAYLHLHFSSRWTLKGKMRFAVVGLIMILVFNYAYYIK